MAGFFYMLLTILSIYFIWQAIRVNIIHPEEGEELRKTHEYNKTIMNMHSNAVTKNNGEVKCPKCKSTQVQLMKRGWKLTTGFLGSSKNERVCVACKHKF